MAKVLALLVDLAAARGLKKPTVEAIVKAVDDFPGADHFAAARDLDYWARFGNGASRSTMAIANTYRNFLKRAEQKDDRTERKDRRARRGAALEELMGQQGGQG